MQDQDLKLDGSMKEYIYNVDYPDYNPADVEPMVADQSPFIISGGKEFQGSFYGPLLFGAYLDKNVEGACYLDKIASNGHLHILYDSQSNLFLYTYTAYNYFNRRVHNSKPVNKFSIYPIPSNPLSLDPEGADVNKLSAEKKGVYLGRGYWYGKGGALAWQQYSIYGITISETLDKIYFYDFHTYAIEANFPKNDPRAVAAYVEFPKPAAINASTLFASSSDYNRVVFFASGNKIYKFDFGKQSDNVALIYTHPDASAVASSMNFASSGANEYDADKEIEEKCGHPVTRSMGISFNTADGKGEFVILNLSNSGNIAPDGKYPSGQIVKGLGAIKDAKFI